MLGSSTCFADDLYDGVGLAKTLLTTTLLGASSCGDYVCGEYSVP